MNNSPSFFVVGAAKSGTTALWYYFQQHPEIFVTKDIAYKELGYYSNQYGISDKKKYLNFFKEAKQNQKIGEVCHAYLTSEESAEWIKKDVPEAKIIIILRNPIDRAYSLYNWMVMHGYENCTSFNKALKKEFRRKKEKPKLSHSFLQNYMYYNSGLYYEQVKRYFDIFGKSKVLVLTHEDFRENQLLKLNEIYDFLNVKPVINIKKKGVNKSRKVLSIKLQYLFRKYLLKKNKRKLKTKIIQKLFSLNMNSTKLKEISPALKDKLKNNYSSDIEKLSKLCQYDFYKLWFSK